MSIAIWVLQIPLALTFFISGIMKLVQREHELLVNMPWSEEFPVRQVRIIGGIELLATVGLVAPGLLGFATFLTPLAGVGVALLMIGAVVVHARRWEIRPMLVNLLLLVAGAVVAWARFGPIPF
ncbi:DoxX family protein [Actinoalloteichus hymeniacidonis]|uniref:DoxX-like family n=1 Tax=Actinoalloteichus hymeniacidonis TaxID=340345 RepID=A0AAC9HRR5_9PSEU|nr:DoxX family protein [Actinoalloteichus hymeniacidonis]AOS63290.1 DoxX-like family [Actinoalloteichus hymeniacidonis]MBB5908671.1 putative membrane protein YphA (DoxX/SURF4 family) [Actinoalloteichus hymeniacidonis]